MPQQHSYNKQMSHFYPFPHLWFLPLSSHLRKFCRHCWQSRLVTVVNMTRRKAVANTSTHSLLACLLALSSECIGLLLESVGKHLQTICQQGKYGSTTELHAYYACSLSTMLSFRCLAHNRCLASWNTSCMALVKPFSSSEPMTMLLLIHSSVLATVLSTVDRLCVKMST